MTNEKVTYMLGAGASYEAFPLVKKSEKWKMGLAEILIHEGTGLPIRFQNFGLTGEVNYIGEAMKQTGINAKEFGNVDSYAKYLQHTGKFEQLEQLKHALVYYFVRQQICKEYQHFKDLRYLNFITSLVDEKSKFPEHVKIINWNYDFQFQLAAMRWKIEAVEQMGNIINREAGPFIEYFPPLGIDLNVDTLYSLVHLNGIAGHYPNKKREMKDYVFNNIIMALLKENWTKRITEVELLTNLEFMIKGQTHLVGFAWDKQSDIQRYLGNALEEARKIIKGTTTLVVIGYSFPFYNRKDDNLLFEVMKPTLKKIYFQDPEVNGEFLRGRYDLPQTEEFPEYSGWVTGVDIEHITDTDQFYIPIEV